jgi:IclR family pca regulon transcriptional regulator
VATGSKGSRLSTEAKPPSGDPNFMVSLARGLSVIRAFSEDRRALTISQVSQTTGLSRAAARRCLYTLRELGYVAEAERRFTLQPRVLTLGQAYLSSTPLAVMAQPFLDAVSSTLGESCSAAILDGDDIVYVCRSAERRIMSISIFVGTRMPAYCTSMGRVLLANLPPDELDRYLSRVKLVARTGKTLISTTKLRKTLQAVRSDGYAVLDQELEIGLRSIAVPVRSPRGNIVAAVNIGANATRVTLETMQTRFLTALRRCARDLEHTLLN